MEWQQGSIVLATAGRDVFCGCRSRRTLRLAGKRQTQNPCKSETEEQKTCTANRYCDCSDIMDG